MQVALNTYRLVTKQSFVAGSENEEYRRHDGRMERGGVA